MFKHEKQLFHPVQVEQPNAQYAALLQEQLGGANGELKAAMQYLSQSFRIRDPEIKDLFLDIAAEESDLSQIKEELMEYGYVKRHYGNKKGAKMQVKSKPFHYVSSDGYDIYVGKNNYQNDELTFKIYHTPGHTPGGVCLSCYGLLFSGDTLFAGSCGRTDFPGGSMQEMAKSLSLLAELPLPDATKVLPGHEDFTTLGQERRSNPYMNEAWF